MKKNINIFFIFLFLLMSSPPLQAEESKKESASETLALSEPFAPAPSSYRKMFVVEAGEEELSDSLNRISGSFETEVVREDQIYKSPNHHRSGPFAMSKAMEEQQ